MIGARTCDKSHGNLSLRRQKLTNTSEDVSRSIASAVSEVQRAVNQALAHHPAIASTSASSVPSSSSATSLNLTWTSQEVCYM